MISANVDLGASQDFTHIFLVSVRGSRVLSIFHIITLAAADIIIDETMIMN